MAEQVRELEAARLARAQRREWVKSLLKVPDGVLSPLALNMALELAHDGEEVYAYQAAGSRQWNIWVDDTRYTAAEWTEYVNRLHLDASPDDRIYPVAGIVSL